MKRIIVSYVSGYEFETIVEKEAEEIRKEYGNEMSLEDTIEYYEAEYGSLTEEGRAAVEEIWNNI